MNDLLKQMVAALEMSVRYLEHPDVAALPFAQPSGLVVDQAKAAIARAREEAAERQDSLFS